MGSLSDILFGHDDLDRLPDSAQLFEAGLRISQLDPEKIVAFFCTGIRSATSLIEFELTSKNEKALSRFIFI